MIFATNFDRRVLLAGLGSSAAFIGSGSALAATPKRPGRTALLDIFADEWARLQPTTATSLGIDTGANAALRAALPTFGLAGRAAAEAQMTSMKRRLAAASTSGLSADARLRHKTVEYATDRGLDGAKFAYGGGALDGFQGGAVPYVVTQQTGVLNQIPEFMNALHPVKTSADAEAYLARVGAMARALDEETAQLKADAAIGVVPPDFIAAKTLGIMRAWRAVAPAAQPMVASLAKRTAAMPGDWAARCTKMVEASVYPAVDRQIATFEAVTRGAPSIAGVARLPQGEAYYAYGLRLGTTTMIAAAEVHRTGLTQNAEIKARIDTILKAQGLTKGSVGERVVALNADPRFLFADTPAGKGEVIAYIRDRIDATRALMPKVTKMGLKAPVEVKAVPADIEDGAPLGYMQFASLDGARPAIYYVNLKSTSLWPKYQLATLSAHEGVPGHAWHGAYLAENAQAIPRIASMMNFNAFSEGWALYAEQIMDEEGLYAADPFGRVGYLQAMQFRACRLVVDTGLHALGWTRDRAIEFLVTETGKGREAMTSEVDRYCCWPGQACGYKVGHNEIVRLRNKARAARGSRFDVRDYNDLVVGTGGVPIALLEREVDRYIRA